MKVFIKGLNPCGMRKSNINKYRNFLIANHHELVDNPRDSEVILLWTCAFRGDFRDNSLSEIKRYQKEFDAELIVCGCLPYIDKELLWKCFKGRIINWREDEKEMQEYFGAPNKKLSEISFVKGEDKFCDDVDKFRQQHSMVDVFFVDQFIKLYVAEGCRFECSYCSERLAFPPYRSFPKDELVSECRHLLKNTGHSEVMLLADCIGDYGHDIGSDLPDLIRSLKSIRPDLKIALQGFNPAHFIRFYNEMENFLRNGDIRHLQLPIQSASDRILRLMNRAYTRADIDRIFTLLNNLGFTEFDTHLIIGFPGETEADYEETIKFILRHHPKYVIMSGFMESTVMATYNLSDKVDNETRYRRLHEAETRIKSVGIICNTDYNETTNDRFRRLNFIAR